TTGGVFDTSVVPEMALTLPGSITASEGLNIGAMIQRAGSNVLAVQLSALQNNGELKILSSPSITTLDNQTATIESGKEVPFQTVQQGEVNVEFKKAVLSLKVTPHVIDGKILKLNILTHKDELDFTNNVAGNPTIITKNAETNVVLFDGQTTVIGGLNKESLSDSESGIPILSDIPLIGHLFKRTGNKSDKEEILIFITPHLLKEPQP
ncbi:MAG TPA: type IV pilus secretin PilQ, partial [Desulfobacteraceae bacterium]|nr:type IV pilus secretin PilQ [Desulfobacteraceae bacterium]